MGDQPRPGVYDYGLAPGESWEPESGNDETPDLTRPHIMTALGPIAPGDLGVTLVHEHLIAYPYAAGDPDLVLDDIPAALTELQDLFEAGGRAVVDMTPADYGRDLAAIRWVAERSNVHIILVTGHHKALFAAPHVAGKSVDQVAAEFVHELTVGIEGTDVRAGAIKAGTSLDEIRPEEEVALRAAARAQRATGATITTHTERGTMALAQLAVLREEGVDPARVIIGHLDARADMDEATMRAVLEMGAWVAFDQIGKTRYGPDEARAAMIAALVAAGYGDQLLLSGDLARKSALRAYGGAPGMAWLLERFPLLLMEHGLEAQTVRRMLVDNPARALAIRP